MDKKKLRNDIILISSLLVVSIASFTTLFLLRNKDNLVAKIYVQDNLIETVDLYKKEEETFHIHGLNGELIVHSKDGAIAVIKSNCPHQDCVKMGYISETNRPIICAYNAVYINIDGAIIDDVEIK